MAALFLLMPLLDVNPIAVWGPIIFVALIIAIPILILVFFLVRALRRMLQDRRK